MTASKQRQLHTLRQLSEKVPYPKGTTAGVIVDCSAVFKRDYETYYTKKLNIIDHTYNIELSPISNKTYLTVYVTHHERDKLPHPVQLGDVIYLRRFNFKIYQKKQQFQAWSYHLPFCSWMMCSSQDRRHLGVYQSSKEDINFDRREYQELKQYIQEMKCFGQRFLANNSILNLQISFADLRDKDFIVKVLAASREGYLVDTGQLKIFVPFIESNVEEGCIAKLRSIYKIQSSSKGNLAVLNYYSSLTMLGGQSWDARQFHLKSVYLHEKPTSEFMRLQDFASIPICTHRITKMNVNVQVFDVTPDNFEDAVKYYYTDSHTIKQLRNRPSRRILEWFKHTIQPIYDITLVVLDAEASQDNKMEFHELFVFDNINFVPRVNLAEINEYSTFQHENFLFKKRIEEMLNADSVNMTIQLLFDQKMQKRIFSVVEVGIVVN